MGMTRRSIAAFLGLVVAFVSLGLAPAYAVDERVIDVVSVTWAGAVAPAGGVNDVAKIIDSEVNDDWKKFTTLYGDTKDRTISFVTGKVLTEPISLVSKMACTGTAASNFLSSIRSEAYKRLGVSDYSKRYLVVIAPKAGCVWSGRAPLGGSTSTSGMLVLHDSASSYVITHELGHTFGLGHSNFLRCDNAANDGAWSDTCKAVEYGGTIDVMGNIDTSSPLNTYHQWRMGYLDDSQIKQVWQSEVVNLAPSDFANGIRAIYIRDGKAAYWVEYRRKLDGVGYKPGLAIYRLDRPPISSIVSPNPEDAAASELGPVLGTDVWMLNLDTYQYRDSRSVGGSMTALTATTYSGNVSFSAVASETGAASVAIGSKTVATIADSKVAKLRVGASIDAGASKKVVRISGSNFVLIGLTSFTSSIGSFKEFDRTLEVNDPSLSESKQGALAKYGFRSSDFGQEWAVLPMLKGTTLDDPSLDLCNGVFLSEKERIERRQVTATKEDSTFAFLSTEVVRYSSAAAASAAQKELVKVLAECKTNKGYTDATGTLVSYDFKTLSNIPAGVVSESNRVFVFTNIDSGANARTLLGFYQFNGDMFTGLYVMNTAGFTDAQVAKWLKVAAIMATRLKG